MLGGLLLKQQGFFNNHNWGHLAVSSSIGTKYCSQSSSSYNPFPLASCHHFLGKFGLELIVEESCFVHVINITSFVSYCCDFIPELIYLFSTSSRWTSPPIPSNRTEFPMSNRLRQQSNHPLEALK